MPREKREGGGVSGSGVCTMSGLTMGSVADVLLVAGIVNGPHMIWEVLSWVEERRGSGPKLYRPRKPRRALSVL